MPGYLRIIRDPGTLTQLSATIAQSGSASRFPLLLTLPRKQK